MEAGFGNILVRGRRSKGKRILLLLLLLLLFVVQNIALPFSKMLPYVYQIEISGTLKADSHIACRAHAAPMPFPCHAVQLRV